MKTIHKIIETGDNLESIATTTSNPSITSRTIGTTTVGTGGGGVVSIPYNSNNNNYNSAISYVNPYNNNEDEHVVDVIYRLQETLDTYYDKPMAGYKIKASCKTLIPDVGDKLDLKGIIDDKNNRIQEYGYDFDYYVVMDKINTINYNPNNSNYINSFVTIIVKGYYSPGHKKALHKNEYNTEAM